MRLILVRHGRPDEGHPQRPHDPPLDAEGRAHARAVARLLAGEGITRVVASPLLRAHETALPLAKTLGLPVDTVDGWAEADRDTRVYRSTETLRAEGPEAWQRFLADPVRTVGGDPERFRADVLGALDHVLSTSAPTARVAVFTHGLPINLVLSHVLGLQGIVHFQPGYGSVTRLRTRGTAIGVLSVNESGHHAWPDPA